MTEFFKLRSGLLVLVILALILPGTLIAGAQVSPDVIILVVDDFGETDADTLDANDYDSDENCGVNLEGQAFAVRGGSADPITVSHGDLVVAQLEELIEDENAETMIDLVTVEVQGLTTDEIADEIQDAIDDNDADFYILNMSISIIPCEYIEAFADYASIVADPGNAQSLNRYRSLFKRAVVFYDDTVFPVMSQSGQGNLDPLQDKLDDLGSSVIPVAAAGNFGLDYPFWPGAWDEVISVSASNGSGYYSSSWDKKDDTPLLTADVDQPGKAKRISNYGEVMLPGEYDSEEGEVIGTSFAAPRLSVALALYVAEVGSSYCRNSDGNPSLAYGNWDNLTLSEVVDDECSGMDNYLP